MKKTYLILIIIFSFIKTVAQCPWSFSITNQTGTFTLTCLNPTIGLSTVNNNTNAVNYLWSGPSLTTNLNSVSINQPGTYSVALIDAITSCSIVQIFVISQNTLIPTFNISPISYTIDCISQVEGTTTASALNPSVNISHQFNWGGGGTVTHTTPIIIVPTPLGTHTYVLTNLLNGCIATQTLNYASIIAYPTFSVTSPNNYTIGCHPTTTVSIINAISTQTPAASLSYTFLPPTFTSVIPQGLPLSPNPNMVISTPGTWTLVTQDDGNFCQSLLQVYIGQGTTSASFSHTLGSPGSVNYMCTSSATNAGTIYNWDFGDGSQGNGINTSHTYSNGGTHFVILNTTNPSCSSLPTPININSIPCQANANFTLFPSGTPQQWYALPSYFGNVVQANWNWGDGNSSTSLFPSHTYSAAGFYTICLSVTVSCANNSSSCSGYSIFKTLNVEENQEMTMVEVSVINAIPLGIIRQVKYDDLVEIYPNPAYDETYISNKSNTNCSLKILDIEGKELRKLELGPNSSQKIDQLLPGVYFINIITTDKIGFNKLFVIQ